MVKGIVCRSQHIQFLLGEVTNVQAFAFGNLTVDGRKISGDGFHHGRFTLSVGTQNTYALSGQHGFADIANNHCGQGAMGCTICSWVAKVHMLHRQHGIGQIGWFFEFKLKVCFRQKRGNFFHAIQSFYATLRLLGFTGFGFEPGNEFLQMRNLVLLLGKGILLQGHLFSAHVFKLAVIAAIAHQFSCINMQGDIGHSV